MKFESLKQKLIEQFPCKIRFNQHDYIEVIIPQKKMSNNRVKNTFYNFLKKNRLPKIKPEQISPHKTTVKYSVGASFICDDKNYQKCVATVLFIKIK